MVCVFRVKACGKAVPLRALKGRVILVAHDLSFFEVSSFVRTMDFIGNVF